jgi:hypothetical protein
VSYFQNVENVGATELIKDENENHFKNGDKGQKGFNKKCLKNVCWEKTKRTCFNLCCGQRAYVG